MIEKHTNVNKKLHSHHLNLNLEKKQINFLDQRFYKRNEEYYPSITNILQYFPKGKHYEEWLKTVGPNAELIARKSADEGTQTHNLIEKYLEEEEIHWINEEGLATCSLSVWQMLLKFTEFWETEKPELIASEIHLFSDKHKIAGTCDLVVKLRGEYWILDIKTSNNLHTSYDLQLAAYTQCWNEFNKNKISRTGLIWLKSSKHKPDKNGIKIQGKGWEIYESPRSIEENWNLFDKIYDLYKLENKINEPLFNSFPTVIKKTF